MSGEGGGMSDGSAAGNQSATNYANSVMGSSEQNNYSLQTPAPTDSYGLSPAEQALAENLAASNVSMGSPTGGIQSNASGQSSGPVGMTEMAVMQAAVQQELEDRKTQRAWLTGLGSLAEGMLSPYPTKGKVTQGISSIFSPATEEELMSRMMQEGSFGGEAIDDGTGNIAMRSSIEDNVRGNVNTGQYGVYGPGKIHRDPSGERNSPLTQLIKTNLAGLNPTEAQAPAIMEEIAQTDQPWGEISLWEALMPKLRVGGTPLGESTNYSGGGLYG